jgi:hypothetical protein
MPSKLSAHVRSKHHQFPFLMGEDFLRRNIARSIEEAEQDPNNSLVEPKFPWDGAYIFRHGAIMLDPTDNLGKTCSLRKRLGKGPNKRPARGRILTYAGSEHGVNWTRPEPDSVLRDGHRNERPAGPRFRRPMPAFFRNLPTACATGLPLWNVLGYGVSR